jgi:hypothetical protein
MPVSVAGIRIRCRRLPRPSSARRRSDVITGRGIRPAASLLRKRSSLYRPAGACGVTRPPRQRDQCHTGHLAARREPSRPLGSCFLVLYETRHGSRRSHTKNQRDRSSRDRRPARASRAMAPTEAYSISVALLSGFRQPRILLIAALTVHRSSARDRTSAENQFFRHLATTRMCVERCRASLVAQCAGRSSLSRTRPPTLIDGLTSRKLVVQECA